MATLVSKTRDLFWQRQHRFHHIRSNYTSLTTSIRSKDYLYTIRLRRAASAESIGLTSLYSLQYELHHTSGSFHPHSSQGTSTMFKPDLRGMLTRIQVASPSVSLPRVSRSQMECRSIDAENQPKQLKLERLRDRTDRI